jgi:hypothetical protein
VNTLGRLVPRFSCHAAGAVSLVTFLTTAVRLALQGEGRGGVLLTFPWSLVPTLRGPAAFIALIMALAVIWRRRLALPPDSRSRWSG